MSDKEFVVEFYHEKAFRDLGSSFNVNNNAMASLIELEKCFISSGESWTQENYLSKKLGIL